MADADNDVRSLRSAGVLSSLDQHFARILCDVVGETDPSVRLASALLSRALSQGHVCLDLSHRGVPSNQVGDDRDPVAVEVPDVESWHAAIAASPLVGDTTSTSPLVLDGFRLYSRRYWRLETDLASRLLERCVDVEPSMSRDQLAQLFTRLFGPGDGGTDWQRVAAVVALHRRLCVITGGPGTGKTHTVAKIVVVLAEEHRAGSGELPDVLLVAPTGKAANRLGESLAAAASTLDCDDEVRQLVCTGPMTIHRALRRQPRTRTRFLHGPQDPLPADLVIVDEASMVDVALMSRLVAATRRRCRLVLLGDRDQLASVEAGAILADLGGDAERTGFTPAAAKRIARIGGDVVPVAPGEVPVIRDSIVALSRNYRYAAASGIGQLAAAINRGAADEVAEVLVSEDVPDVVLCPWDRGSPVLDRARGALRRLFADDVGERLSALGAFRILCALRRGPYGVEGVNRFIEERMRRASATAQGEENYAGRPIMIVQNDIETGLFNGDVGVMAPVVGGGLRAWFPQGEGARSLSLGRLPSFETVYATTVHKSQGSEFDEVAIVLPDQQSPILNRELLYTAVTRAKSKVTIYGTLEIVKLAVSQRVERASGLRDRLWGDD